jgi:hypothetical protein
VHFAKFKDEETHSFIRYLQVRGEVRV